jgi:hypothetical protein
MRIICGGADEQRARRRGRDAERRRKGECEDGARRTAGRGRRLGLDADVGSGGETGRTR